MEKEDYEGKFFYEVVDGHDSNTGNDVKMLFGPFDNIYFVNKIDKDKSVNPELDYKYCRVIDNKIDKAFLENEILVTDRKL